MAKAALHSAAGGKGQSAEPTRLQINTSYTSVAEFVRGFSGMVEANHVLVSLDAPRPCGSLCRFSVRLADGTPAFEGLGRIVEIDTVPQDRGAIGARLELVSVDEGSRAMHTRLLMARQEADADEDALFDGVTTMFARGTIPMFARPQLPLQPPPAEEETTRVCSAEDLASALDTLSIIEKQDSEDTRIVALGTLPPEALRPPTEVDREPERVSEPPRPRTPRVRVGVVLLVAGATAAAAAAGAAFAKLF